VSEGDSIDDSDKEAGHNKDQSSDEESSKDNAEQSE